MCKENKNSNLLFFNHSSLPGQSPLPFMRVSRRMRCALLQAEECTCMSCGSVVNAQRRMTRERRHHWIKSFFFFLQHILVLMSHGLFQRCPYYVSGLLTMLVPSMQGQKARGSHQKYLNLSSEDGWRSYGFGTTWVVIHDRIVIPL